MPATIETDPTYLAAICARLASMVTMHEAVGNKESIDHFLHRHGRPFEVVAKSPDFVPWANGPGECFMNTMELVGSDARHTYVEGHAIIAGTGCIAHHAWCIDPDGRVHDPTWQKPGDAYFGVPFSSRYVMGRYEAQLKFSILGSLLAVGDDDFALVRGLIDAEVWQPG